VLPLIQIAVDRGVLLCAGFTQIDFFDGIFFKNTRAKPSTFSWKQFGRGKRRNFPGKVRTEGSAILQSQKLTATLLL
jgi:hypothetical protein